MIVVCPLSKVEETVARTGAERLLSLLAAGSRAREASLTLASGSTAEATTGLAGAAGRAGASGGRLTASGCAWGGSSPLGLRRRL